MILGIGIDIVHIQRFGKKITQTPGMIQRLFTPTEQQKAPKNKAKIGYFAKRFAAKEAMAKACGTGIGKKLNWQDMEILNDECGKPVLTLTEKARRLIYHQFHTQKFNIHLSLADDQNAIACVILEK